MEEFDNQSGQSDCKRLSKRQLSQRLDTLLGKSTSELDIGEAQYVLQELHVHQIELEIKIHELGEAQERLEKARDQYAELYDFSPVGYLTLDRKGIIRNINLTAAIMLGAERAQLEGLPFVSKLSTGEHRVFYNHLAKVFDSGKKHACVLRLKQSNDHFMDVHMECLPVKALDGEANNCHCAVIDITRQKLIEDEVRAERDRAQLYLDTVEAIIVALDTNGQVTLLNRRGCELLGYEEHELIGKNWFETCLPQSEGKEIVEQAFRDIVNGNIEGAEYYENLVVTRDGEQRLIAWHNNPLHDKKGGVIGTLSAGEDISDRKQLEQELHLLYKTVEQNPNSVIVTDVDGRIEYINSAFSRKTGYDPGEVLGKTPSIIQSGVTPRTQYKKMWKLIRSGEDWAGELLNKKKSGELFWEQVSISAIRNSDGDITHFLSIQEDITEQKRLKEHAQQHQAELAFMARLNTMGEMATGLAHELNQPLAAINTYADVALRMLNAGIKQPDKLKEVIEGGRDQAIRANELIRHLRQLVKKQSPETTELNLNELIASVLNFLETEIQNQAIKIELHLHQGLPQLVVDAIQIEQVLINLIRNAIEAEGPTSDRKRELIIRTDISGDSLVRTEVSDTGPGMDKETLSKIFDPFFSTKGQKGMGMGLSICRSIIEAHDGRLWAISEPGEGSAFFFNLPIKTRRLKCQDHE